MQSFLFQLYERQKNQSPRYLDFITCKDTYPLFSDASGTKHINFIAICGFLDAETQKKKNYWEKKFCFRNLNCPSINLAFIRNGNFMSHFINLKHIIYIKAVSSSYTFLNWFKLVKWPFGQISTVHFISAQTRHEGIKMHQS